MPAADTADAELDIAATTDIIGYRLRRAQLGVFQRFNLAFAALDLRPAEFSVMSLIAENPGRKQTEIGEVLGIKRANFVVLVNGLETRGLIERRSAKGDKRANALHLTEEGRSFLVRAQAIQDAFESDCIDRIGGRDARDMLIRLLDQLA